MHVAAEVYVVVECFEAGNGRRAKISADFGIVLGIAKQPASRIRKGGE